MMAMLIFRKALLLMLAVWVGHAAGDEAARVSAGQNEACPTQGQGLLQKSIQEQLQQRKSKKYERKSKHSMHKGKQSTHEGKKSMHKGEKWGSAASSVASSAASSVVSSVAGDAAGDAVSGAINTYVPSPPPPPPQEKPENRLITDMARLAEAVYGENGQYDETIEMQCEDGDGKPDDTWGCMAKGGFKWRENVIGKSGDWKLAVRFKQKNPAYPTSYDNFAIYSNDDAECALSIAGTDDLWDVFDDCNMEQTVSMCGEETSPGFANEVRDLLDSSNYTTDFLPYLQSHKCSGGIYVTGHSLGGAIASVIAGCAAKGLLQDGKPHQQWPLAGLYTIGAPGSTRNPITAGPDGQCLPGLRAFIWNQDHYDPVPWITSQKNSLAGSLTAMMNVLSFDEFEMKNTDNIWHPQVDSVMLTETPKYDYATGGYDAEFTATKYGCSTYEASHEPKEAVGDGLSYPYPDNHYARTYVERLEFLYPCSTDLCSKEEEIEHELEQTLNTKR